MDYKPGAATVVVLALGVESNVQSQEAEVAVRRHAHAPGGGVVLDHQSLQSVPWTME
jgi:hypothetical protein